MNFWCWLKDHDFKHINSEAAQPGGVAKVTDRCSRCNEKRIIYYPSLPIPPREVICTPSRDMAEVHARMFRKAVREELEKWRR